MRAYAGVLIGGGLQQPVRVGEGHAVKGLTHLVEHLNKAFGTGASTPTLYQTQGWIRRAAKLRAAAVCALPWEIKDGERTVWQAEDGTDLPDELAVIAGLRGLLYRAELSLAFEGAAYFLKLRDLQQVGMDFTPTGAVNDLQYLNPLTISLPGHINGREANREGVDVFERIKDEGGVPEYIEAERMIWVWEPDPYRETGPGSSDAGAVTAEARVLHNLNTFLVNHTGNGLLKATLLGVPMGTTENAKAGLLDWFKRKFTGGRADTVGIVEADSLNITTIGEGLSELADTDLVQVMREAVSTGMGVPHGKLMSNQTSAKATAEADSEGFLADTIIPQGYLIAEAFNEHLLGAMGYSLTFDLGKINAGNETDETMDGPSGDGQGSAEDALRSYPSFL